LSCIHSTRDADFLQISKSDRAASVLEAALFSILIWQKHGRHGALVLGDGDGEVAELAGFGDEGLVAQAAQGAGGAGAFGCVGGVVVIQEPAAERDAEGVGDRWAR
jgi:hypothetical protein